jgi:hypothetical protein
MRELQALCLDVATYKLDDNQLDDYEVNLMSENIDNPENLRLNNNLKALTN